MLEILEKKARKSYLITMAIMLVIAIVLIAITKLGIVTYFQGSEPIGSGDYADYEGKYVSMEVAYPLEIYEKHYSENTKTHETRTTNYGYVVYDDNKDDFLGVVVDKVRYEEVEATLEEAWAYLNYETDTPVQNKVFIEGTMKKMDSDSLSYFNKTMSYIFTDYEYVSEAWYIDDCTVNGMDTDGVIVMTLIAAVLIVIALFQLVLMAAKTYRAGIKKYLSKNPGVTMEMLESEFARAQSVTSNAWVGNDHTFIINGRVVTILNNKEIVWAYYYYRTGKYSVSELRYYGLDRKRKAVNLPGSDAQAILACYDNTQPHMLVGYDNDYERMLKRDFQGFLDIKYNPAQTAGENTYDASDIYGTTNPYGSDTQNNF